MENNLKVTMSSSQWLNFLAVAIAEIYIPSGDITQGCIDDIESYIKPYLSTV